MDTVAVFHQHLPIKSECQETQTLSDRVSEQSCVRQTGFLNTSAYRTSKGRWTPFSRISELLYIYRRFFDINIYTTLITYSSLVDTATTSQGREARMMECEKSRMLFLCTCHRALELGGWSWDLKDSRHQMFSSCGVSSGGGHRCVCSLH